MNETLYFQFNIVLKVELKRIVLFLTYVSNTHFIQFMKLKKSVWTQNPVQCTYLTSPKWLKILHFNIYVFLNYYTIKYMILLRRSFWSHIYYTKMIKKGLVS